MTEPIDEMLAVKSRQDLIAYLARLSTQVRQGSMQVENVLTHDFLEAASAWLRDSPGFFKNNAEGINPDDLTWAIVAAIFSAGLVYE